MLRSSRLRAGSQLPPSTPPNPCLAAPARNTAGDQACSTSVPTCLNPPPPTGIRRGRQRQAFLLALPAPTRSDPAAAAGSTGRCEGLSLFSPCAERARIPTRWAVPTPARAAGVACADPGGPDGRRRWLPAAPLRRERPLGAAGAGYRALAGGGALPQPPAALRRSSPGGGVCGAAGAVDRAAERRRQPHRPGTGAGVGPAAPERAGAARYHLRPPRPGGRQQPGRRDR